MCGRFYLDIDFEELCERYGYMFDRDGYIKSSELYPSQSISVVRNAQHLQLESMTWGLEITHIARPLINTRSETAYHRKSFKKMMEENRCIVPAAGYFEWHSEKGRKIKYKIGVNGERVFSMAAIYSYSRNKSGDLEGQVSILTKEASSDILGIHDRMPVILSPEDELTYLSKATCQRDIEGLFHLNPAYGMVYTKI